MLLSEAVKLVNSLLLALAASEWLQTSRLPHRLTVLLAVLNLFLADWGILATLHRSDAGSGRWLAALLVTFLVGSIAAALYVVHPSWSFSVRDRPLLQELVLLASSVTSVPRSQSVVGAASGGLAGILVGATLMAYDVVQLGKLIAVGSIFMAVGYFEVRRCLPDHELCLASYARHVGYVGLWLIPAYPFLAVLATPVLLLIVDVTEAIFGADESSRSHTILNELVFDGTFYSPFMALLVGSKSRCLKMSKAESILPTCQSKRDIGD
mmetsp:Transcript_64322/g.119560  ORF Transcript_64322/g.119560 Transcript_64322/m.119560 type:complete len:267 (-) Transcript_64322:223-1023(-)